MRPVYRTCSDTLLAPFCSAGAVRLKPSAACRTYQSDGNGDIVSAELREPGPRIQAQADSREGNRAEAPHKPIEGVSAGGHLGLCWYCSSARVAPERERERVCDGRLTTSLAISEMSRTAIFAADLGGAIWCRDEADVLSIWSYTPGFMVEEREPVRGQRGGRENLGPRLPKITFFRLGSRMKEIRGLSWLPRLPRAGKLP